MVAADGTIEAAEYVQFFAQVRGSRTLSKGVLRVHAVKVETVRARGRRHDR